MPFPNVGQTSQWRRNVAVSGRGKRSADRRNEKYPQIHFSVKLRLGWENAEECLALLPLFNALPLTHIILHPRLGKQQYKGEVDLSGFEAFYNGCEKPLLYNGDLHTVEDIQTITERFPKLAGVVIGRGLLANPALAWEYRQGKNSLPMR